MYAPEHLQIKSPLANGGSRRLGFDLGADGHDSRQIPAKACETCETTGAISFVRPPILPAVGHDRAGVLTPADARLLRGPWRDFPSFMPVYHPIKTKTPVPCGCRPKIATGGG